MSHQHVRLAILLSSSGHDCVDLGPIEHFIFGWGPNLTEPPSFLGLMFYNLTRKITCCCNDPILSASGQQPLSPMKNYNFGWGPNFLQSPSLKIIILDGAQTWQNYHLFSVLCFTTWHGRLLVAAMALLGNKSVPRTLGSIHFFLLQVNSIWTPWKIIILDGAQTFYSHPLLSLRCFTTFNGNLHVVRIQRCLTKQSSRYPSFWLGSKLCRFEPHWKL